MIIQIRGTSGSGKSTIVRGLMLMDVYDFKPHHVPGRRKPLYYTSGQIAIMGHYSVDCGGCDTIGSAPQCYSRINVVLGRGSKHVLAEGLLLSEDVKWTLKLPDPHCIFLTTTLEECLRRVKSRQKQAGRIPKDPERVVRKLTRRITTIASARRRLQEAGVPCYDLSQDEATEQILSWLK